MHQCPGCKSYSISSFKAWGSSVSSPVYCTSCSELSYAPSPQSYGPAVGAILILLFGGLATAILKSYSALIVGFILATVFYVWRWREVELVHYVPSDLEPRRHGIVYTVLEILGLLSILQ